MPIDSGRYSYSPSDYAGRYATKHQSIAPETYRRKSSWEQDTPATSSSSWTPLIAKQPHSAMSPAKQKELDQLKKTKETLEGMANKYSRPDLPKELFEKPTNVLEQIISKREDTPESKNPLKRVTNSHAHKQLDAEYNKSMIGLYRQAERTAFKTERIPDWEKKKLKQAEAKVNGADGEIALEALTLMGRGTPWFGEIRKENRKT